MRRALLVLALLVPAVAPAKPVFAPGTDAALDLKMARHDRYYYQFVGRPFGIGLTGSWKDEAGLQKIRDFLAQDAVPDFQAFAGVHPYDVVGPYEGAAGIGLRGGGAVPGTAFRYQALKAEGAPKEVLDAARKDVVKALEAVLVDLEIAGVPGIMARGIARMKSADPDEPVDIPYSTPNYVPLFDEQGNPLPEPKNNGTDRMDNSGGKLPPGMWYWQDSCSKDQMVGWVVAMATLYDAAKDDPDIDQALIQRLQEHARQVGAMLREKHPRVALDGETYDYDLLIWDADGRPTQHSDLTPLSLDTAGYFPPDTESLNIFNLVMALGIVKGLWHVSGDPAAETYLYDELMGKRRYLDHLANATIGGPGSFDYIYMGSKTNFSNVNMIAIALFLNIWFEKDPDVRERTRDFMEKRWWDVEGVKQSARWIRQPYFHAFYLAMTGRGFDATVAGEAATALKAFELDPYEDFDRVNCDETEVAARECVAVDGSTILKLPVDSKGELVLGRGDILIAAEPLSPAIRPSSNFDARSNPFAVNGSGGKGLNPGGDLHAGYWLLRWLPDPGDAAGSPRARDHVAVPVPPPDGVETVEPAPETAEEAEPVPDVAEEVAGSDTALPDLPGADTAGGDAALPDVAGTDLAADEGGDGTSGGGCQAGPGAAPMAPWALLASLLAGLRLASRRRRG